MSIGYSRIVLTAICRLLAFTTPAGRLRLGAGRVNALVLFAPSPANQRETGHGGTPEQERGRFRHRVQLASDFTAREVHGVDVQISHVVLNARDQRGLGLAQPALHGDKGRVVD